MEIFKDIRIPLPESFESPSLTRVGKFQRGLLTCVFCILPVLQGVAWQRNEKSVYSGFRCDIGDGDLDEDEQKYLVSRFVEDYRNKYSGVSQGMFIIFILLSLSIIHLYMSYVSERFNSWFKLKTRKQRGKIVTELKTSTAVFRAHFIQLATKLVSSAIFIMYNCLAHSIVLPSRKEYQIDWTPSSLLKRSSISTTALCYADQALELSIFNVGLLSFVTFCGILNLTELVYTWQETRALEQTSDYYFCMFLLRHNSVTEATNMQIEKELFLEEQRNKILLAKRPVNQHPFIKSWSSLVHRIPRKIFISQRKLKFKGIKKQKHKQELFRTYSRTKKIPVTSLQDFLKPDRDTQNPKIILLTGPPGIGKTELVAQIVEEFNAVEIELCNLNFVFVFNFKELNLVDEPITLQAFLNLSLYNSNVSDVVYQQIVGNPEEVLFIFDGLNEWSLRSVEENGLKMSLASLVLKLLTGDLLSGSTIIVTSRPTPLLSEISEMVTFDRYAELACFKPEDLKTCIQECFQNNEEVRNSVKKRISSDNALEVLCRLPQNCRLFCLYVDFFASKKTIKGIDSLKLPATTTELFERMIETVIAVESDESNHEIFPSDHYDFSKGSTEVLEKLSCLALEGIINERYVFRKEEFSQVELSAFEVEILEEAGLLSRLRGFKPNMYCFSCLSLQEYFAASRIVQSSTTGDFRDFLEKANENHCATLQFVAGLCKDGQKGKSTFVCLMQHLTQSIKLNNHFVDEPVVDNQAIAFLCKCIAENPTKLGLPFAKEVTSSISPLRPIVFTEMGNNPLETQAVLFCLKEANGCNVKRVIFEGNCMEDDGFRQVAASLCHKSCKLDQVSLTNSGVTDGAMLSFLESTASHSFLGIRILGLRGNDISSEGAKYLACVLFNDWCQLEELHLGNNRIGDQGVEYFSEALCCGSSKIHTLDLSSNGITHNGVYHLSKALSNPVCNVKRLYLQQNRILDFGMQDLCESLCIGECNLRVLFVSSNEITDNGIVYVEKALTHKSCRLQELYLGYNLITDKGVKSLLQALPTDQINLKILSLANNPITDTGVKMLANALRNSSCNLHRLFISLGRSQLADTKRSKLQVRYVNAF